MIETELRPTSSVESRAVAPMLGSGGGGNGWGDDDPGEGWGWSDGHDDEATPYRRSRIVRAVALVTAAAVVTGSIGTWVAILAVGSPPSYTVSAVHAQIAADEQRHPTGLPVASVSFVVSNNSSRAGRASCHVVVSAAGSSVGSAVANTVPVAPGTSTAMTIRVSLSAGALASHGPAGFQVACTPIGVRAG